VHGSVAASELADFGLKPSDVLDFSVNTNPLGPAPGLLRAIANTDWSRYPGDDEAPLCRGLARQVDVTPDHVALGNGSAELLWLIALAVLSPGDEVTVLGPTFGEYARAARTAGAQIHEVRPSMANFVLVDVGDAAAFRRALLPHGKVVRDCTSFGLPSNVRIACRLPEQCARLIEVVAGLKEQGSLPESSGA